jgi:hypothetical protein
MSSTASAAAVGPKQKSQDDTAKAKRMKRLYANPDFVEAVENKRALVKTYQEIHAVHLKELDRHARKQDEGLKTLQRELQLQQELHREMKRNRSLQDDNMLLLRLAVANKRELAANERTVAAQESTIQSLQKARNPHRVTGGKRGRPKGSKSKAIRYGADAMPDSDMVPLGTRLEVPPSPM